MNHNSDHRKKAAEAATVGSSATGTTLSQDDSLVKTSISREDYKAQLHPLQVEMVKLQRHIIGCRDKILVLLEGRDAAGKDGSIKRIVEHFVARRRADDHHRRTRAAPARAQAVSEEPPCST